MEDVLTDDKSKAEEINSSLGKPATEGLCSRPDASVNLRDLSSVDSTIKPGVVYRSSQVIYQGDAVRLGIRTVLDLRRTPVLCRANPMNTGQLLRHTFFKGRVWFSGLGKCHIRLGASREADHNRALPCKRCTAASMDLYGVYCVVYHVDLIPTSVGLSVMVRLPPRLQLRVVACAVRQRAPEPLVAAAIANPDVMGWFKFYKILLKKAQLAMVRAVRVFANPGASPVLMHCIHGKDRTGLVAMLLLQLCDVPASSIINDYKVSELLLRESRENNQLISLPEHLTTNEVMAATASVIEQLIKYIDRKWGGARGYLRDGGMLDEEIAAIRVNLMVQPSHKDTQLAHTVSLGKGGEALVDYNRVSLQLEHMSRQL